MSKKRRVYVCDACGFESPAWFGKCPSCSEWNTAVSMTISDDSERETIPEVKNTVKTLAEINSADALRLPVNIQEFDRITGGGIVAGSVSLISGEPGIGKSTLMLQVADKIAKNKKVLYVTGEESLRQVRIRAERLGIENMERIEAVSTFDIGFLKKHDLSDYGLLIFDSLQTMKLPEVQSLPGSVVQVRECANFIVSRAKMAEVPVFIVGHITKGGQIAGPKLIEHLVDSVLYFESSKTGYRFLRTIKNRFGPADEIAVFEMTSGGLKQVQDISGIFVEDYISAPGNVIAAVSEGSRSFLVEVQSLVSKPIYGTPRRLSTGIPIERVLLISAVLAKRAGIPLDSMDIYVNIAGGLQIEDTGLDLAVAVSLVSSFMDRALPDDLVAFGEIGLDGTVRSVQGTDRRTERIKSSKFKTVLSPDGDSPVNEVRQLMKIIGGLVNGQS